MALKTLDVSARKLAKESGVDQTLISRWRQGERPITRRSKMLPRVVNTLLDLDADSALHELLAPYRLRGETVKEALTNYLTGEPPCAPLEHEGLPALPNEGEYTVEYRVYLGQRGFRHAALTMLDYLSTLPPGRQVMVLCQGKYEWLVGNLPFVLQFIAKLKRAVSRETRLLVINRRGYSIAETSLFAIPWLVAHLRGYIRSQYYDGDLPSDIRFAASIPGYWSGHAEEDSGAEDGLYVAIYTDPRNIRRDEELCKRYLAMSRPASQYGFLKNPQGTEQTQRLWRDGPLPAWAQGERPDGSFFSFTRVPGFGVITADEFSRIAGESDRPPMPEYLFSSDGGFSPGEHRIILCREAVRDGLINARRRHEAISELLGRRVYVNREMLADQIDRLLIAMKRENFKVALVPWVAFSKLQLELVCFENSISVGWLQDMEESVFADDKATSGSFYGAVGYVWDKLMAGWRSKERVAAQLRKWLSGKDLQPFKEDSATAKNWDIMPK